MVWTIEYRPLALKSLKKLDRQIQIEIVDYLSTRIATSENPNIYGKPLIGNRRGLWRFRLRDYRIICEIQNTKLVVLVLEIGHRSTVYE